MAAKTELDAIVEFAQATLALTPVIILGSGASAAHGIPGMWPLAAHLGALSVPVDWQAVERDEWQNFTDRLAAGTDLEAALQAVRLSDRQTAHVAEATRTLLLPDDERVFLRALADRRALPLTRLFKYLFTSTHRTIDVITPNYDRLAEYAADAGEFGHYTGFTAGYLQSRPKASASRPAYAAGETGRTVRVWKVHGSLDWFHDSQGQIVGIRVGRDTPPGFQPLMITPGIDKYRLTHTEPFRTIFTCSDAALESARSYFCVGYGFNDPHVQEKLVERCDAESVPIIVITKDLSDTARAFLTSGRCRKYLALEEGGVDGARAYTPDVPGGVNLPGPAIWTLPTFLDFTLGIDA